MDKEPMTPNIILAPIAIFKCDRNNRASSPRQPFLDVSSEIGIIQLHTHIPKETLIGLEGASHLWLIYQFHKNEKWKPMTEVQRQKEKLGLFATRSPYRPNPLGLSLVELKNIQFDKRVLEVQSFDLLNETPILDIKPYVTEWDSVPTATLGWVDQAPIQKQNLLYSTTANTQLQWLREHGFDLKSIIEDQLGHNWGSPKLRIKWEEDQKSATFAYRTWRALIRVLNSSDGISNIEILAITLSPHPIGPGVESDEILKIQEQFKNQFL